MNIEFTAHNIRLDKLQAIQQDVGFDLVMEQFDSLGSNISKEMTHGYYKTDSRGTFIGIKTKGAVKNSDPKLD